MSSSIFVIIYFILHFVGTERIVRRLIEGVVIVALLVTVPLVLYLPPQSSFRATPGFALLPILTKQLDGLLRRVYLIVKSVGISMLSQLFRYVSVSTVFEAISHLCM